MLTVDQILAAQRAQVETLFGLTNTAFASAEKLMDLNISAAKAALNDAQEQSAAVLSAKDAQELIALQAAMLQPLAEKTAAYSRHLYEIATEAGAEFSQQIEGQTGGVQAKVMGLVDNVAQNAPVGSETAVAMLKSSMAAASNAFESVQKVMKQASELTQANMRTVADSAAAATSATGKKASSRKR